MRKKYIPAGPKSSIKHYLMLNFICILTSLAVFMGGNYLFGNGIPCANSKTCKTDLSERIENDSVGFFAGRKVIPPKINITSGLADTSVLGTNTSGEKKHIFIDLSTQKLYAYEGTEKFMETFISSGRWGRTPVGNFNIWIKLRATRMSGGQGADYYNLPNVPHVMYFYHDFGLHGAYWHNNFGHTMSHGCVNMRLIDAKKLFEWADGPAQGQKGTPVSVCDKFTKPDNCVQNKTVN